MLKLVRSIAIPSLALVVMTLNVVSCTVARDLSVEGLRLRPATVWLDGTTPKVDPDPIKVKKNLQSVVWVCEDELNIEWKSSATTAARPVCDSDKEGKNWICTAGPFEKRQRIPYKITITRDGVPYERDPDIEVLD